MKLRLRLRARAHASRHGAARPRVSAPRLLGWPAD
ncbi:hypothetical protein BU14_1634s0002 [Porphyra umbilicalis]|uniref:Uncharacterized protein n=1 Tax=Porphyra umbilicalis TaxID=2786 RepID=A0A1X6NLG2_PORUM|nr:hypothetical protein BU14_1634s0002 [Porphyra umbilicalis]|eukprot:OSX69306.1 hypothetical protein BU14_1634s0002 [Porphyra umbilicalis]